MDRARALAPEGRIKILTGQNLLPSMTRALEVSDPAHFLVEPEAKGTAPVLVWAAWTINRIQPGAVIVSLHADHVIDPLESFGAQIRAAAAEAGKADALFTIGVPPTRPETGFGYILPGSPFPGTGELDVFEVASFVEKPDSEKARRFVADGYLWNSGLFIWRSDVFLEEVRSLAPEIGNLLPLLERGDVEAFFRKAPSISVDEAVLERSSKVVGIRAEFSWDDIGSWEALARTGKPDPDGNVSRGSLEVVESSNNIVVSDDGTVVLFGVEDLVVVREGDVVLVAHREKTPEMKAFLKKLPVGLQDPE
jgi:mannose-1-phosphate guanylyltransferase